MRGHSFACWAAFVIAVAAPGLAAAAEGERGVVPGEPAATPTIECIGIMWPVEGDENGSAKCAVAYREAGAPAWREALPLHRKPALKVDLERSTAGNRKISFMGGVSRWDRHTRQYGLDHWGANYLAGSIFSLKPGVKYEVRLSLADPDGNVSVEKTLAATTRTAPAIPSEGNKVEVTAEGGREALAKAFASAKPGDIILVHKGTYKGPFRLAAGGTAERPIVVRAAGDGPAVVEGKGYDGELENEVLGISGSHVRLHGLEIRGATVGVNIGYGRLDERDKWKSLNEQGLIPVDVSVTRCSISKVQYAIIGTGHDCYVADNDLVGVAKDVPGIDWSEGEGIEIRGRGTVACYNRMYHVADGASIYDFASDQDFHHNEVYSTSDDGIELDYSDANNRVWDNRFFFASNNGISFQPYIGGPCYIIRNQVLGSREGCLKDRYGSSDVYFMGNTFVGHKAGLRIGGRRYPTATTDLPMNIWSRDNLYLIDGATDEPAIDAHAQEAPNHTINMDYDGLGGCFMISSENGGKEVDAATYPGARYVAQVGLYIPIDSFRKVAGALEHYTLVDAARLFEAPLAPIRDWREDGPMPDMRLKKESAATDAGIVLPSVNENYAGKAPDLGALESGTPEPVYGPRPPGTAEYEK